VNDPPETFVTISGCSSGGKSTLLAELRGCGFATIDEPGRRIVDEELKRGGAHDGSDQAFSPCAAIWPPPIVLMNMPRVRRRLLERVCQ
jgi:predicted ATPase